MDKREELEKIAKEILKCRRCSLWETANKTVVGEGNPEAEIMFIGEAPGFWEDREGRPFVGQAGKLLDKLFSKIGLERKEVFITNVLKHRPPGNRDPLPAEISACKEWLDRQIEIIKPRIIVTLGRFALAKFLPSGKITRIHGQMKVVSFQGRRIIVFPLFHPAAGLRNDQILKNLEEDFQKIPGLLKVRLEERKEDKGEQLFLPV